MTAICHLHNFYHIPERIKAVRMIPYRFIRFDTKCRYRYIKEKSQNDFEEPVYLYEKLGLSNLLLMLNNLLYSA